MPDLGSGSCEVAVLRAARNPVSGGIQELPITPAFLRVLMMRILSRLCYHQLFKLIVKFPCHLLSQCVKRPPDESVF